MKTVRLIGKFSVKRTNSKCFNVAQLISKVRNQLGTNMNALRSITAWEKCCFDRLKETYEEVVCYIELRNFSQGFVFTLGQYELG